MALRIAPLVATLATMACYSGLALVCYHAADYEQAVRINPGYAPTYYNRGLAYYERRDYDRAISDLNQAINGRPNYPLAFNIRGLAYLAKGETDRGIQDFDQAIRRAEGEPVVRPRLRLALPDDPLGNWPLSLELVERRSFVPKLRRGTVDRAADEDGARGGAGEKSVGGES